ncbi:hypothetical protein BH11MYX1_BH11MYX1_01930 [soil metagenome]
MCFLDISASPEGRSTLVQVAARTADQVFVPLTVDTAIANLNSRMRCALEQATG